LAYPNEDITTVFTFGGENTVSDSTSVGTPEASAKTQGKAYTQCVAMVNCDVDNNLNAIRREGYTNVVAGNVTSAWSNGTDTFVVMNRLLHTFDGANINLIGNSPAVLPTVEFCQVNNITAFSDDDTIGLIEDGIPYLITTPAEATDILDLETWVKLTYPAGFDSDSSNFELDAFKLATYAGKCLEFFNGALYVAVGNFIFCTKTFDIEHMDLRKHVVAGFSADVTMIKAVNDGLFVGTENGTFFLAGMGLETGFEQRRLLPYPVIYGSGVSLATDTTLLQSANFGVFFMTSNGVYAGGEGGRYKDIANGQITAPSGSTASAILRSRNEATLYTCRIGSTTIVVNTDNGAHTRYTNYSFDAFFKRSTVQYGANSGGIYMLTGEDDDGTNIDAYFTTPNVDFGDCHLKTCPDAYLHVRSVEDLALDLYVDEVEVATDIPVSVYGEGVKRARAKLPLGAQGTNWQFKVKNVNGSRFDALSLKVNPAVSKRTI
jgi:hypothetical protein